MDTKKAIELAMIKCSVRYDPENINAWIDTHTHGQMAKEITEELMANGYCLKEINPFEATIQQETELTTNDK